MHVPNPIFLPINFWEIKLFNKKLINYYKCFHEIRAKVQTKTNDALMKMKYVQ